MNKLKLVDNWRQLWRAFSLQANVIGLAIIGGYTQMPDEFKRQIHSQYILWASGITFALGALGRLVHQPSVGKTDEDPK